MSKARCKHCNNKLSRGSIDRPLRKLGNGNLIDHLKALHEKEYLIYFEERKIQDLEDFKNS